MNKREHARLAEEVIDACGGLDEIDTVFKGPDRLRTKSVLSGYQNPNDPSTMPAEVMFKLQRYGRTTVYSDAISAGVSRDDQAGDLSDLTCQLTELSASLQRLLRETVADKEITPREFDRLAAVERDVEDVLRRVRGARLAAEAAGPHLKAVRT